MVSRYILNMHKPVIGNQNTDLTPYPTRLCLIEVLVVWDFVRSVYWPAAKRETDG